MQNDNLNKDVTFSKCKMKELDLYVYCWRLVILLTVLLRSKDGSSPGSKVGIGDEIGTQVEVFNADRPKMEERDIASVDCELRIFHRMR